MSQAISQGVQRSPSQIISLKVIRKATWLLKMSTLLFEEATSLLTLAVERFDELGYLTATNF